MPRYRSARTGFTLMEMLTVISVITLLMSITLPSLSSSKEAARKVKCASNLNQQGIAMSNYLTNTFHYPGHAAVSASGQTVAVWPTRLRLYAPDTAMFDCPSAPPGFNWQVKTGSGALFAQGADTKTWGYKLGERLLVVGGASGIPFSYGYNDWGAATHTNNKPQRGLGGDLNFGSFRVPELKDHQVANPSNMIAIGDNTNDGNWDFCIDPTNPTEYPGKLHLKGANMAFADTHVEFDLQSTWVNIGTATDEQKRITSKWNNHNRPTPDQQ